MRKVATWVSNEDLNQKGLEKIVIIGFELKRKFKTVVFFLCAPLKSLIFCKRTWSNMWQEHR